MLNFITAISRIFVGGLFIFSGFVKAVDPLGFSYKLQEYFEVFGMEFLMPIALVLSILLVVIEILCGVYLLFGLRNKQNAWLLLGMIVFFTWLTGYSAITGKVTDCGCFGDAIPLEPIESFYKDLILLVLIVWLFIRRNTIKPLFAGKERLILACGLLFSLFFPSYGLSHLPVLDFRAYQIGSDIKKGMEVPEGAALPIYEDTWYYDVNDKVETFTTDDKPWEIPGARFVDRKSVQIQKGYVPPIHDFTIVGENGDVTEAILNADWAFLFINYDMGKSSSDGQVMINKLAASCDDNGIIHIGMTGSLESEVEVYKRKNNVTYPFFTTDPTTLKTIVRSNPGIVLLQSGVVRGKWHFNDTPNWEDLTEEFPDLK
ncbi:MAG: putative membrane protein YphA (DoxX/SURF4 family) [Candidatus Azotimanducaceae bacterium]|jgi:uncharacterized membrane protein YphA (DoxX/SURF4 family)